MEIVDTVFYVLLFVIAFLYASVGHGGASGYLALMALFSFAPETMRSSALLLNILVSLVSFSQYYQAGHFKWKLFYPFILGSIPAAFIGGLYSIDTGVYKKILAVLLLFSAFRFLLVSKKEETKLKTQNIILSLIIGAVIGLFSGMIGIGGGIILSPLLLLLHWANMKQTAAVSALFIFINSIAGFAGVYISGFHLSSQLYSLIGVSLIGGMIGAYSGSKKIKSNYLQIILALVLIIASVKLILT